MIRQPCEIVCSTCGKIDHGWLTPGWGPAKEIPNLAGYPVRIQVGFGEGTSTGHFPAGWLTAIGSRHFCSMACGDADAAARAIDPDPPPFQPFARFASMSAGPPSPASGPLGAFPPSARITGKTKP